MKDLFSLIYKAVVAYQGTNFLGWQSQLHKNTVQDYLEFVLYKLFKKKQKIVASSRTDAGVHAYGQVFIFSAPQAIDKERLLILLNNNLSDSVFIRSLELLTYPFHPRYDAKKKIYQYAFSFKRLLPSVSPFVFFVKKNFDIMLFSHLLKIFEGEHDFRFFSYLEDKTIDTMRTIYEAKLIVCDDVFFVTLVGNGFLRYMVRKIVGFLFLATYKNCDVSMIKDLLQGIYRECSIPIAPAKGLLLKQVLYLHKYEIIDDYNYFF